MKPLKFDVKDIPWTFCILSDKDYETKHGVNSHGITDKYDQYVDFKASSFRKSLVNHEIFHVFVASCCIGSVDEVTDDAMEEIGAEILEFHLEQIDKITKKLYNTLKDSYARDLENKEVK
jgi:hypothetical protein